MKTLIIVANPSKTSFTHGLAESYKIKNENCEILDLYDTPQGFLKYESMNALQKGESEGLEIRTQIQEKIASADELVFFFPVWWGGVPAILKNFFDQNFSSGFAFKYVKGQKMPKKLLTDKIAKVYCHCDAPGIVYKIPFILGINIKWYLSRAILGFCGVKLVDFKLIDSLRGITEEKKKAIINTIGE